MYSRKLFYLGLEPLAARYTKQLCEEWFPNAIKKVCPTIEFTPVHGMSPGDQIKVGTVLDATGRGIYSCYQVTRMLEHIRQGDVHDGDVIFLQDFWTPGFEAVPYALELHGLKGVKIFSMLHAQTVDEYDFVWPMRHWMRPMEIGLSRCHAGIFVGSTIHREQLRAAGFECPIHVVGLPIDVEAVMAQMDGTDENIRAKENFVVFTSRLDSEKNPSFMLAVAHSFLTQFPDWTWVVTTSAKEFRSNQPGVLEALHDLAKRQPRFILLANLSKNEYYDTLVRAKVQFNCSLQDYVSWTLLEAGIAECNLVYPAFRSFPELMPEDHLYHAFAKGAALQKLRQVVEGPNNLQLGMGIARRCDLGRIVEAEIVCGARDHTKEVNVWTGQNL